MVDLERIHIHVHIPIYEDGGRPRYVALDGLMRLMSTTVGHGKLQEAATLLSFVREVHEAYPGKPIVIAFDHTKIVHIPEELLRPVNGTKKAT